MKNSFVYICLIASLTLPSLSFARENPNSFKPIMDSPKGGKKKPEKKWVVDLREFHGAVSLNDLDKAQKMLTDRVVEINKQDPLTGRTALFFASTFDMFLLLYGNGADDSIADNSGTRPAEAAQAGQAKAMSLITKIGVLDH